MKRKKKQSSDCKQEVSLLLCRDPILGFCWKVSADAAYKKTVYVGGFDSIQQMFSDIDFLEMLQHNLGGDAVPASVVEYAHSRELRQSLPIPDEVVVRLKETYGALVVDKRPRNKK